MLVLTRRCGEEILIFTSGERHVKIRVLRILGNRVRLGIEAPLSVEIWRSELVAQEVERGLQKKEQQ